MDQPSTDLSADQLQSLAARLRVGLAARAFREHLAAEDLAGAWGGTDPALRLTWATGWTHARQRHLVGICPHCLALGLAAPSGPEHPQWRAFARDQLQAVHDIARTDQHTPSSPGPPPLPADIEVLYADPGDPGRWSCPNDPRAVPMLMRWNGTMWMVLNYGSATLPGTRHPGRESRGQRPAGSEEATVTVAAPWRHSTGPAPRSCRCAEARAKTGLTHRTTEDPSLPRPGAHP